MQLLQSDPGLYIGKALASTLLASCGVAERLGGRIGRLQMR